MNPFDVEIIGFTGELREFSSNSKQTPATREIKLDNLRKQYRKVSLFPTLEITPHVWNTMYDLAQEIGLA